jgi:hypothetical protein
MPRDPAELLAEAGAVVGGGAALGGTLWFIGASIARDLGRSNVDPLRAAERGAAYGGALGIALLIGRFAGVH